MAVIAPHALKELIVRVRARHRELDRADWDGHRYRTPDTAKWEQAAKEIAPHGWCELVSILAQGWDYYGGSDLPGDPSTSAQGRA